MGNLQLDWSTAEVSSSKLTVSLDGKPTPEWCASFERTVQLLDRGTWADIKLKKQEITVKEVEQGTEEKLRFFLESVVQEANAEQDSESDGEESASGEQESEEESEAEDDPDRQMTDRFKAFAPADGEEDSSDS